MTSNVPATCPRCGAPASGNFCSSCGTPLAPRHCTSCGTSLSPGARFCHKCGAPADAGATAAAAPRPPAPPRAAPPGYPPAPGGYPPAPYPPRAMQPLPSGNRTPWIVAGVLVIITVVAVVWAAFHRIGPSSPDMANAGNSQTAGTTTPPGFPSGPAPDISKMTPREQFDRLDARITQAASSGDTATVVNFTPMALGAYANLPAADRDIDARYDAAMLMAQVGMLPEAKALADTILQLAPNDLLGYYVKAQVAGFQGDSASAKAARAAFRDHYSAEISKNRPEYTKRSAFLQSYLKGDGAH